MTGYIPLLLVFAVLATLSACSSLESIDCFPPAESNLLIDKDIFDQQTMNERWWSELETAPATNLKRMETAISYFSEACPELKVQPIPRSKQANIFCEIPGALKRKIVIGAHYDKTGRGQGVADNWTGVLILTALLNDLNLKSPQKLRPGHTMLFVLFGEEETGMVGSRFFLKDYLRRYGSSQKDSFQQKKQLRLHSAIGEGEILGMVNLDTLGLGGMKVDYRSDKRLACSLYHLAERTGYEVIESRIKELSGDWEIFMKKGIPTISLHSVNKGNLHLLHGPQDRFSKIKAYHYKNTYKILLSFIRQLDQDQ